MHTRIPDRGAWTRDRVRRGHRQLVSYPPRTIRRLHRRAAPRGGRAPSCRPRAAPRGGRAPSCRPRRSTSLSHSDCSLASPNPRHHAAQIAQKLASARVSSCRRCWPTAGMARPRHSKLRCSSQPAAHSGWRGSLDTLAIMRHKMHKTWRAPE